MQTDETTADKFFSLLGMKRSLGEREVMAPVEAPPEAPAEEQAPDVPGLEDMALSEIAAVIRRDWQGINYAARPYLSAMFSLDKITDQYGMDSGHSVVTYFMSNAGKWRGPVARAVKGRLRKMLKSGR